MYTCKSLCSFFCFIVIVQDDVMAVTPEDFPTSDYFAPRMASGDEEADGSSGYSKLSFDTAVSLDPSPPELG